MGNLVEFGDFSPEAAADARQEAEDEGNEFAKIKEGWNTFRILPPPKGYNTPFRKVYTHYIPNPEKSEKTIPVTCPKMTKLRNEDGKLATQGRGCVLCDRSGELRAKPNQLDRDRGYNLRAQPRTSCNIIDRKDPGATIKVLRLAKGLYDELIALREDEEDPTDFSHPLEGYDIRIHRVGTSKEDTEYKLRLAKRPSPLFVLADGTEDYDTMNELITGQIDLDNYASLPSDDEIMEALEGGGSTPRRRMGSGNKSDDTSQRRSRRRANSDVSDDGVVDGEIVDDENEDDLPPGM